MARVALIETKRSATNFKELFENSFEFDRYALCSDSTVKRVLKKDVDIEFISEDYDWIILVGSDACKYFTKITSVSDYSGKIVDEKYIPIINPSMLSFKPEAERLWQDSRKSLIGYITGAVKKASYDSTRFYGITTEEEALAYVQAAIDSPNPFVALDSETTGLYPRDGYVLGISLCYERDHGAYIDVNCITDAVSDLLQKLFLLKIVIFHNAKFDRAFFTFHFGWGFPRYEDTMLLHYCLDESPGTHGLKQLALKYTIYGDYEKDLTDFIDEYRKKHSILKEDFTYDLIPFDIIKTYAAIDAVVTFLIYIKFKPAVNKNAKLAWVYENILIEGSTLLEDIQNNGVPFDRSRLVKAQKMMQTDIDNAVAEMYLDPKIKEFEEFQGKPFNPNSTQQLRKLMFDFLGLTPTGKKTGTNADSTDAEVLETLAQEHPVPGLILNIRKKSKIKNTYLDKILPQLDRDSRLRTNFNLHSTTSGRLSSSGKMNMQQLPRDNPAVKGCIKARPGYKIVSIDLTTAEVYVAAVLANDRALMDVFASGGDFHSTIAKLVFNLDCPVEEVKTKYKLLRQAAKAVTFGIMYGAGSAKIAWQVTKEARTDNPNAPEFTKAQADKVIKDYFKKFHKLASWISDNQAFIATNGYIYSHFGRKRRLPNAHSSDRGMAGHTIRSGINFLVQSVASDVNLLAAIDMNKFIKETGMSTKIFALVHDSILAEVPEDEIDHYVATLTKFIQTDRGISIPNSPIGCDFEIGDDYSFGKYEKYEAAWDQEHGV